MIPFFGNNDDLTHAMYISDYYRVDRSEGQPFLANVDYAFFSPSGADTYQWLVVIKDNLIYKRITGFDEVDQRFYGSRDDMIMLLSSFHSHS